MPEEEAPRATARAVAHRQGEHRQATHEPRRGRPRPARPRRPAGWSRRPQTAVTASTRPPRPRARRCATCHAAATSRRSPQPDGGESTDALRHVGAHAERLGTGPGGPREAAWSSARPGTGRRRARRRGARTSPAPGRRGPRRPRRRFRASPAGTRRRPRRRRPRAHQPADRDPTTAPASATTTAAARDQAASGAARRRQRGRAGDSGSTARTAAAAAKRQGLPRRHERSGGPPGGSHRPDRGSKSPAPGASGTGRATSGTPRHSVAGAAPVDEHDGHGGQLAVRAARSAHRRSASASTGRDVERRVRVQGPAAALVPGVERRQQLGDRPHHRAFPTTRRSGRIRSACRTSCWTTTPPAPSMFGSQALQPDHVRVGRAAARPRPDHPLVGSDQDNRSPAGWSCRRRPCRRYQEGRFGDDTTAPAALWPRRR